ncbi:hypothetical protein F3Y22_tig00116984pilonHSYRG00035 [Hibiscus syriacus]|uniref:Pectinesterase inhibitor domain-containing protein n=1 Tax=Hibiscus syriacus TaxID=106335 RepID=A0A6A2XGQ7_HIBSY|nr:uncharacterized protein LOC120192955 [Hibiscus syriacus]KAE8657629.1 hypothetical protein F3Y22_tig00116984pilonHSYRG00035 [Hibiscus syriacus]
MKSTINNGTLALYLFICISFFPLLDAENKLVTETCQKLKEKDLCLSRLGAEQASQDAKDIVALTLIAINVAASNGSETATFIRTTLSESAETLAPTTEQNFEDCSENFEDAMQDLDDALALVTSRDFKGMKTEVGTALDDANECAAALNQGEGKDLELFNRTNNFLQLCSIVDDLAHILAPSHDGADGPNSDNGDNLAPNSGNGDNLAPN